MSHDHPLRILVLYDPYSVWTNFVIDHLASFREYLPHDVWYAAATCRLPVRFDLQAFDVVIVHFCVRVALANYMSADFARALKSFDGLKLLCIQDEYDSPLLAAQWIRDTGIHTVFTCVPEIDREAFYPRAVVGNVRFVQTLTGYVSTRLAAWPKVRPIAERRVVIGYRGRELPFRYGLLAREKYTIGKYMREVCRDRGIAHDIEWNEARRIMGNGWYSFLGNCRVMLATESGSNIVDADGSLSRALELAADENPELTFEEAFDRYLRPHEGRVRMNQAPPKLFEAAALKTALLLFEGEYSNVVKPGVHFILLRKDFANLDEVLAQVADCKNLQEMVDRTHHDLIKTGKYCYSVLMDLVNCEIASAMPRPIRSDTTNQLRLPSYLTPHRRPIAWDPSIDPPYSRGWTWRSWRRLPARLRRILKPILKPGVRLFLNSRRPSKQNDQQDS